MRVYGFVVMPEHVHLLLSEPERGTIATAIQSLKISSAKRGKQLKAVRDIATPFWQKRYYDRNVGGKEFTEKLKYIHRNPVKRKLVASAMDWKWSSYRHYTSAEDCGVQIESWRNKTYKCRNPIIANRRQLWATRGTFCIKDEWESRHPEMLPSARQLL